MLKAKTLTLRMQLIKLLSPSTYHSYLNMRPMDKAVKVSGKQNLIGAEIGVYKAEHSKVLLNNLPIQFLYLVDFYQPQAIGSMVESQKEAIKIFQAAKQNVKKHQSKVHFIIKNSVLASLVVPNNSLDFCYIDAGHTYEAVKDDVASWYPKVKSGGIIGGHDFCSRLDGLVQAVQEFASANNLKLEFNSPDWWVQKP